MSKMEHCNGTVKLFDEGKMKHCSNAMENCDNVTHHWDVTINHYDVTIHHCHVMMQQRMAH